MHKRKKKTKEYEGIQRFKEAGSTISPYSEGIHKVCEYIIECTKYNPIDGDYSEENRKRMVEAGELLNKDGGSATIHEVMELWVPKRYQREIDGMWDGIGQWRS